RQVATLVGLSEDAVKKRLERARSTLRQSLLDEVGEFVRRTAPGAAFTMAVAAGLSVGAPASASAAGAVIAGSGTGPLATTLAPALGAAVAGTAVGVWGVRFGIRPFLRTAIDEQERKELLAVRRAATAIVLVASSVDSASILAFVLRAMRLGAGLLTG